MSQTVARAIEVLQSVAQQPRSLGEVAESLDVHKSTALRLLQTLEASRFVLRIPGGRYAVGPALVPLGRSAMDQLDLRSVAHGQLVDLMREAGHTVHLAELLGDEVVYVDKVDGVGSVAVGSRIGLAAEMHTAAVAKVVLAFQPEPFREQILGSIDYSRHTASTMRSPGELRRELGLTRERGWAEDDSEREDFINCIALPIRDASGLVIAGVSVTALRAAEPLASLRLGVPALRKVADRISTELGWKAEQHGRV